MPNPSTTANSGAGSWSTPPADDFEEWSLGWGFPWKKELQAQLKAEQREAISRPGVGLPTPPTSAPPSPVSLSAAEPHYKCDKFQIVPSSKGGLGAFALKDIEKGTLILSDPALLTSNVMGIYFAYENLSPEQRKQYLKLHCFYGVDDQKIMAIYKTNRFHAGSEDVVCLIAARFNHACLGSCNCSYFWDRTQKRLVITASQYITAGEELTISYAGFSQLPGNYGFHCDCKSCPKTAPAIGRK